MKIVDTLMQVGLQSREGVLSKGMKCCKGGMSHGSPLGRWQSKHEQKSSMSNCRRRNRHVPKLGTENCMSCGGDRKAVCCGSRGKGAAAQRCPCRGEEGSSPSQRSSVLHEVQICYIKQVGEVGGIECEWHLREALKVIQSSVVSRD